MHENMINLSGEQVVTAEQVLDKLNSYVETIAAGLSKQAQLHNYPVDHTQATLDFLYDKAEVFSTGLLPADDYSFLSKELDHWLGMGTVVQELSDFEASDLLIHRTVNAIQGAMIVNKMLSEEAIAELSKKRLPESASE
jgi:hypothetical protein